MAHASLLFKFKTSLRAIITKLPFTALRRKPKSPSPTTSVILPDVLVQDATYPSDEITFTVVLDPVLWWKILSYCEVIDITRVSMTCRSLASIAEDSCVWHSALLQICHRKRLPHLHLRIRSNSLPYAILQRNAILLARLDRLNFKSLPYAITHISLQVSTIWCMSFLPGGEWLVMLCRRKGSTQEQILLCKSSHPLGQPFAFTPVTNGHGSSIRVFTSDQGDLLLLLRSDRPNDATLSVYSILPSDDKPCLELVCRIDTPKIENYAVLEGYLVFGWLNYDASNPRHYVKVMMLTSCQLSELCTMKVKWDIGKHPHSYGLRVTDSQLTLIVSSTELIAAYAVPTMTSHGKPVTVPSFWRFSCAHMSPRAVYMIPSLPAVDVPSVIIFYGNRCLFISPNFDADPRDSHPTCFSTYIYPRYLKRPILLGPHRAFWDLGGGSVGTRILPTPLLPAVHGNDPSVNAPEGDLAQDVLPLVYAENYDCRVERAAWDEETGRLALCSRPSYERDQAMTIFLVDMAPM